VVTGVITTSSVTVGGLSNLNVESPVPEGPSVAVMHVITGLGSGGAETMLLRLGRAEVADGRVPVVVSLTDEGVLGPQMRAAGLVVETIGMRRARPSASGLLRMARLIRRHRPAIVQTWLHHADVAATLGLLLSGRRSVTRLIWGIRCSDMSAGKGHSLAVRLGRLLSTEADHLVANSAAGLDLHLRLGYRPRATSVVPNGIDVAAVRAAAGERDAVRRELGIAPDTVVAILPARLHPMKDHWTFAAALAQAPGIVGLAVGEGTGRLPDRPNMIRLGLRSDVPRLLAAADMVVSTSAYGEGFSNAVAEGMAAGLPAVATDVGDARALVGEGGFVVPPRDPGAVANAMRTLADRPRLRERMGAAAAARIADHFTIERCVARFRALYDQVEGQTATAARLTPPSSLSEPQVPASGPPPRRVQPAPFPARLSAP